MSRVILQVPVSKDLHVSAKKMAEQQGFSSLQEIIRVFLRQLAQGKTAVRFEEEDERLSLRAARRYARIIKEIEQGRGMIQTDGTVEDFLRKLDS